MKDIPKEVSKYMSELGKKGAAAKTPEQRKAAVIKGWETRKAQVKHDGMKYEDSK